MALKNRSVPADAVLPHINYQSLGEALTWLEKAFGIRENYRYGDGPSGGQMWAGKAAIQVRQAGGGQRSPAQLGYGTQSLTIFVDDVDGHYARAKAAGAKILEKPHETGYGEYQYAAEDLDGHHWLFSRHAKDCGPEEWGGCGEGVIDRAAPPKSVLNYKPKSSGALLRWIGGGACPHVRLAGACICSKG